MDVTLRFVIGALIGLIGLVGLYASAHTPRADAVYEAGLIVFGFAVLYIFLLIKRGYDQADRRARSGH